mmetsp:Transcript_1497/g.4068  ORF Transcript_1497/g.4068 Transcript_1497/m.4068 type:complete len:92 (-) Transcript_1497:1128-1403(-)
MIALLCEGCDRWTGLARMHICMGNRSYGWMDGGRWAGDDSGGRVFFPPCVSVRWMFGGVSESSDSGGLRFTQGCIDWTNVIDLWIIHQSVD